MRESRASLNRLQPGQVLEHIIFEVLDSYQNPVSSGGKVKVLVEGFELQDRVAGHQCLVDENGCLDLRLRVTAGYGETARVELRSTEEDLLLWDSTFDVINRKLRITNDIPHYVAAGSQLEDIVIEAVDEDGQVDATMGGLAHMLTLDWNPNIAVPLQQGRCTLPPIQIPQTPGVVWRGCVKHTQSPELQVLITVVIGESEKVGDELMVSESPSDVPARFETTTALTKFHAESRALQKQVVREVQHDSKPIQGQRQGAVDRKRLEGTLQKLNQKATRCDAELARLKQVKKEYEDVMRRYQGQLDILGKGLNCGTWTDEQPSDPTLEESPTTFERTHMQVAETILELGNPPGTHAAAILLQAQRERYSEITDVEGIVGIVALLGAVEKEECNRALVDFLGLENMLAIVCKSNSGAECLGVPPLSAALGKSKGLLDSFAESRNLKISVRYRVITLTDESSFYKGLDGMPAVNDADPQKPLNFLPLNKPGTERLVGSLGYAVNMMHLNEDQLKIRISGRGLRETLFFVLFGYLEVFDTTNNMFRARRNIRSTAVSLDGGLIRKTRNQYELGPREDPVVWFPALEQQIGATSKQKNLCAKAEIPRPVQRTMTTAAKQMELKRKRELERIRYFEGGTEADIMKCSGKLSRTKKKIAEIEQQLIKDKVATTPPGGAKVGAKVGWA